MKSLAVVGSFCNCSDVAPYTGAWIEIGMNDCPFGRLTVAPYTGAWIQIVNLSPTRNNSGVAPYTGAWIEIM